MEFANKIINRYGVHDTVINKITIKNSEVALYFNEGLYLLDKCGRETELMNSACKVVINIPFLNSDKAYEYVEIIKIRRKKVFELDFKQFVEIIDKSVSGFEIEFDYYSAFAKSLMLNGYIQDFGDIVLKITGIKSIDVIVDNIL